MEMKLTDYLPWWRVTSTYLLAFHKDVKYQQRKTTKYIQCIFYFEDFDEFEVENIYNGLKNGHEKGLFTEFDLIAHPTFDSILILKWKNNKNNDENKLCWKRHNDPDRYYESYTIDEYDDGRKVLCRGEYEISINELEKLPKIK